MTNRKTSLWDILKTKLSNKHSPTTNEIKQINIAFYKFSFNKEIKGPKSLVLYQIFIVFNSREIRQIVPLEQRKLSFAANWKVHFCAKKFLEAIFSNFTFFKNETSSILIDQMRCYGFGQISFLSVPWPPVVWKYHTLSSWTDFLPGDYQFVAWFVFSSS